jgi:predicted SprT family Zn-dependent metalloprotease
MSETTHSDEQTAKKLAAMFAPSDANYVFVCTNCRTSWWKQRDCPTTRGVRNNDTTCGDCGNELIMAIDKQQ